MLVADALVADHPSSHDGLIRLIIQKCPDQISKVKFLNTLRARVSKRCPVNKVGSPIVTDFDLVTATAEEIHQTLAEML